MAFDYLIVVKGCQTSPTCCSGALSPELAAECGGELQRAFPSSNSSFICPYQSLGRFEIRPTPPHPSLLLQSCKRHKNTPTYSKGPIKSECKCAAGSMLNTAMCSAVREGRNVENVT